MIRLGKKHPPRFYGLVSLYRRPAFFCSAFLKKLKNSSRFFHKFDVFYPCSQKGAAGREQGPGRQHRSPWGTMQTFFHPLLFLFFFFSENPRAGTGTCAGAFFVMAETKRATEQTFHRLFQVEVTGLEPAASWSQTIRKNFFRSFLMVFIHFRSFLFTL